MELTQTIKAACRVTASLNEHGDLSVKVFASAPYNPTGGTATAELTPSDRTRTVIATALAQAIDDVKGQLGDALGAAIHTSREAAKRLGE